MSYETKLSTEKYQTTTGTTRATSATLVRSVYMWMCTALLLTGATASFVANTPALIDAIISSRILFWGLLIAQFGLVWAISSSVTRYSLSTLSVLFMVYSILTGVTFSIYFLVFTAESIASTFFVTAGTFAVMSLYGYLTKADLTKLGNLAFMALIGILLASVVNFFLHSEALYWGITYIGVLVFVGLIAYDTQKIKALATLENNEHTQKLAICGALSLYLDFINLFLMLLRIMGRRR